MTIVLVTLLSLPVITSVLLIVVETITIVKNRLAGVDNQY